MWSGDGLLLPQGGEGWYGLFQETQPKRCSHSWILLDPGGAKGHSQHHTIVLERSLKNVWRSCFSLTSS